MSINFLHRSGKKVISFALPITIIKFMEMSVTNSWKADEFPLLLRTQELEVNSSILPLHKIQEYWPQLQQIISS